jgi:hypothetical protein
MKDGKLLFYLGLSCIWTGVMLRIASVDYRFPMWFFIVGGLMKFVYLYMAYRKGRYKPGVELLFLAAGLLILALGINLRIYNPESVFGPALVAKAVVLKAIFIFLVIRKLRQYRLQAIAVAANNSSGGEGQN